MGLQETLAKHQQTTHPDAAKKAAQDAARRLGPVLASLERVNSPLPDTQPQVQPTNGNS